MDPLIALLIVVTSILTILLVIVGVYVILILRELRYTMKHLNTTLDEVDTMVHNISQPFSGMGNMMAGVKSGLKVAETFVLWLKEKKHEE